MAEKMREKERIRNSKLIEDILPLDKSLILITGVGISGKSTFRRALFDYFKNAGKNVEHYDADKFKETRHPLDKLCLKELPEKFSDKIYLIEDIHAPLSKGASMPISNYDKIFYISPDLLSHNIFWFDRMNKWYEYGKFSWEAETGWNGTGKRKDSANMKGIVKAYLNDMENREEEIKKDLKIISKYPHKIVKSAWTKDGPVFF